MFDKLLQQIRAGEPAAAADLYATFAPGLRLFLQRSTHLSDVEDLVFGTLLDATRKIRTSTAVASGSLAGIIRGIAKSRASMVALQDQQDLPVGSPAAVAALTEVLQNCTPLEREILLRYYFLYEPEARIASQLNLPASQPRAIRKAARDRYRELLAERDATRSKGRAATD